MALLAPARGAAALGERSESALEATAPDLVVVPDRPPSWLLERRRSPRRRRRYNRHLRPVLARGQRRVLACLIVLWSAVNAWAWSWWLQPSSFGSPVGLSINSALLSVESIGLPVWFFFWIWRMRRPDAGLEPADLRTAMVVTKAPSEPWPVVRETLEAMLDQDFPFDYDVWLADEQPSDETCAWTERHGVSVSTREGVVAYHRPTWPRRTRCKEGNLAHFYDTWGYELYDVVAQLDADHVPDRSYLRHIAGPFRDPHVGYVAAPSICDRNAEHSWSARGRLYAEAVLHGPTQAGHSGGCAPSCIGSHYAVRTSALREIGGLGPELAEDFTTTLMMSSHGWHGVFAVDAVAHGDGPATIADCMTQEFQWSRSMMNVLLQINRRYWSGLSRAAKLRLGFCQIWYPLFAILMLASVLIPIVAIVTRTPPMRVSLGGFYLHFGPPTFVLLLAVLWLRRLKWLRPVTAKAVSWEIALFQLARWPWVLFGCAQAIAGWIARREFSFRVTPKGRVGCSPLPFRVVLPYVLLALICAAPAILNLDAGRAHGYYVLTLINATLYLLTAIAVVVAHVREHPRALRRAALAAAARTMLLTATTVLIVAGGVVHSQIQHLRPAGPPPWPLDRSEQSAVRIGVSTAAFAENETTPWSARELVQVNGFEQAVRAHAAIAMWFADWAHSTVSSVQLGAIERRGSVPEISWEPWDHTVGLRHPQPRYTLQSIIDGRHDGYIHAWARALHNFRRPVLLRFAQEMNGSWYPWSEGVNDNRPGQFVAAWRHVHDIFSAQHASNVRWIWSPVSRFGLPIDTRDYPGNAYVDVLAVSGFNGGSALPWTGWRSFPSLFDASLATLRRLAPAKPIQISEVASAHAGGDEAKWIREMFADVRRHRSVTSLIWFDLAKQTDWRITGSSRAAAAFAAGVRSLTPAAPPGPTPRSSTPEERPSATPRLLRLPVTARLSARYPGAVRPVLFGLPRSRPRRSKQAR